MGIYVQTCICVSGLLVTLGHVTDNGTAETGEFGPCLVVLPLRTTVQITFGVSVLIYSMLAFASPAVLAIFWLVCTLL